MDWAAIALRRVGWQVTVLERAGEFTAAEAGIVLLPNAVRVLDELEVDVPTGAAALGGVRTSSGRWLVRWDPGAMQHLLGTGVIGLHRAELHSLLLSKLPQGVVRTGVDVGEVPDADLVVAADGIDSRLRALLWPELPSPVYNGVTTWRGVSPAPASGAPQLSNSWGHGTEFGMVPLVDGRVYWFGAVPAPAGESHADERAAVREHFGAWHDPIGELIDTSETVLHLDIRHLAVLPRSFVSGRVVLLGDAADAMPPNVGQGGGLALEDAVVLAAGVADSPDVATALTRYDRQRRPRTAAIARQSAGLGRVMAVGNPLAVALRDTVMRMVPNRLAIRGLDGTARWQPPELPK